MKKFKRTALFVTSIALIVAMLTPMISAAGSFGFPAGSAPISVKLDGLPEDHKKMLEFYLSFWLENRDTLINGKLIAANPESIYSIVCAEKDGNAIFTAYTDTVIDCTPYSKIIAVNSSRKSSLIIKGADGKSYKTVDCMGNILETGSINAALCEINVPLCGMIRVE